MSRKITNAGDRKRLREIVDELDVPQGMGLIVRTAGAERTRAEIKRDYEFLLRQWEQVRELTLRSSAPCLIYEEGSLIKRVIRDIYSREIEAILVEGEAGYREAKDYMKMLMPSHAKNVQQYAETIPLFMRYQVESFLNGMFSPVVQLRSGGYIVIGITEALVAIDVNSGRSTREGSIEETAVKTNLEAADEVARQLRLRDLAGLIVIDFIDMDESRNNRAVEKRMKERLKTDRARIQVGRISAFGLMEMSRQRLRPGMLEATTQPCPHCHGTGMIRSDESLSLAILREIEEEGVKGRASEIIATMPVQIANYIINSKRAHLARIESRYELSVSLMGDPAMVSPEFKIERSKTAPERPRTNGAADSVVRAESGVATVAATAEDEVEEAEIVAEEAPRERVAAEDSNGQGKKRRRGKRGGRRRRAGEEGGPEGEYDAASASAEEAGEAAADAETAEPAGDADGEGGGGRRRRNRGGRRRNGAAEAADAPAGAEAAAASEADAAVTVEAAEDNVPAEAAAVEAAEREIASAAMEIAEPESETAPEAEDAAEPDTAPEAPVANGADTAEAESAPAEDTAPAEPEAVDAGEAPEAETAVADPEPEPEQAAPAPAPEPDRPKRRGWWSLRR
ncbi:MAG: Rne/Rng family ribonuclease [Pseudomonadota bacterium]